MKWDKKDWWIILGVMTLYVLIRSLFFVDNLNFSTEQADFAAKSLTLWREKKIELIGPAISFRQDGREIFQGSSPYYFQLLFLLPGNADPVTSSYLFMIFGALMVVPCYLAMADLAGRKSALMLVGLYTLIPTYINYSRFLWNPNFQFTLTTISILFLSKVVKSKSAIWSILLGMVCGFLLTFHYQYLIVIGIILLFLISLRQNIFNILMYLSGLVIGFSPIIIFELRHNFYNLRTALFFLQGKGGLLNGGSMGQQHYYLSISLLIMFLFLYFFRQKNIWKAGVTVLSLLFIFDIWNYTKKPINGFGMSEKWNYRYEQMVSDIIAQQQIESFNVVNLIYNTKASVQKYLLAQKGIRNIGDDYENNQYLFVITDQDKPLLDPAYEVNRFSPATETGQWILNDKYKLFLFRRI